MEQFETKSLLEKQLERGRAFGSFMLQNTPVVGPWVQGFFDQEALLHNLITHEGERHLAQMEAELAIAEACGPVHEADELRSRVAQLAVEMRIDSVNNNA